MKKPEWTGIATAVAIIFILVIVVVAGRDPDFKLKDWQTFAAACVALVGGAFAYGAAMAKVNLDRKTLVDDLAREKLGVFLRLRANLWLANSFAESARAHIEANPEHTNKGMALGTLGKIDTFDFDEPWEKLHFFPPSESFKIANLRTNLTGLNGAIETHGETPIVPAHIERIKVMLTRISQLAGELQNWVGREISGR